MYLKKPGLHNILTLLMKCRGFGSRISGLMREKAHIVSETYGTLKTAVALQSSFTKLQEMEKKSDMERQERGEHVEAEDSVEEAEMKLKLQANATAQGLEALWRGSKLEVESVLREVCESALEDVLVDRETRMRRCAAMLELGLAYQSVADEVEETTTKVE